MNEEMKKNDQLLTIKDVADMFQMSVGHVKQRVVKQPDFPAPIKIMKYGQPRYKRSDILAFIDRRKEI
ncbi:helix-turn-helix transcriptional regulator [Wohlfahrtiimonas larvae]|uniref:Helix-turn-helix domain-containing protein n=1 Tax=Wohlfahrtiimonas larvae TaxID=1157986 RepID=A0ABP9MR46_9GAMM|nr:helix-turn-helix domain-containing protein [Wohlfahrtiimonas larvae]